MPSHKPWEGSNELPDALRATRFDQGADSKCLLCPDKDTTAEAIYAAALWDYYYCYQCRSWFKVRFDRRSVFLPVRERAEVKRLVWIYTTRMASMQELRRLSDNVESLKRYVERHVTRH